MGWGQGEGLEQQGVGVMAEPPRPGSSLDQGPTMWLRDGDGGGDDYFRRW